MYFFTDYFEETEQDLLDRRNKPGTKINVNYVVNLSPVFFEENLKAGLRILGTEEFMSYKDLFKFNGLVLNPLLDLLEEYDGREPDEAKDAAGRMIKILEGIDTDDDMFPKYEVENIRNSIKNLL